MLWSTDCSTQRRSQPSLWLRLPPGARARLPPGEGTSLEKARLCRTHGSWGKVPWPDQRGLGQTPTASAQCRPMELSEALKGRREFISTHRCLSEYRASVAVWVVTNQKEHGDQLHCHGHISMYHLTSAPPLRRDYTTRQALQQQQVLSKHHSPPDPHRIPSNTRLLPILLWNSHRLQGGRQLVQSHAAQQATGGRLTLRPACLQASEQFSTLPH